MHNEVNEQTTTALGGKIIYLKRNARKTISDLHPWPVRLVGQTPVTWYGYSASREQEGKPNAYSKLAWTQVPPPDEEIILLNFAGPLKEHLWIELFAGWEQLRIQPDTHHLLVNSSLWLEDERAIHKTVTTLLGRVACVHHWKEGVWEECAESVVALYPEQERPQTLLQQSLKSLFGKPIPDAFRDIACRQAKHERLGH